MSPQPLELSDVLPRFQVETNTTAYRLGQRALLLAQDGRLPEAVKESQAALRDSLSRNDRGEQAIACAYLAAVYAQQANFVEAVRFAEDCYRLFSQAGDAHNLAVAQALLAVIYRMHLDQVSCSLIESLRQGQEQVGDLRDTSSRRGNRQQAANYHQQFMAWGEQLRRARWIPATPHALPLIWLSVVDTIAPDPEAPDAEPVGYLEPVLFVLKSREDVGWEDSADFDQGRITDQLYSARPLPPLDGAESDVARLPRLRPDARYVAIRVDPDSARTAGLKPDDYLLVRRLGSHEKDELAKHAGENITGYYFKLTADGTAEVVRAIPPKFVGEEHIKMLVAQVDAILRRVQ